MERLKKEARPETREIIEPLGGVYKTDSVSKSCSWRYRSSAVTLYFHLDNLRPLALFSSFILLLSRHFSLRFKGNTLDRLFYTFYDLCVILDKPEGSIIFLFLKYRRLKFLEKSLFSIPYF